MGVLLKSAAWVLSFAALYFSTIATLTFVPLRGKSLITYITKNTMAPGGYGFSLQRFREAETAGDVDVLFSGSSHAYRGFDTRQYPSFRTFNIGSYGQTPYESYFVLKEYLPRLTPELVVFECYFEMFTLDNQEALYDLLVNLPLTPRVFEMALFTGKSRTVHAFFAEAFRRLRSPLEEVEQVPETERSYVPGGFVEDKRSYPHRYFPKEGVVETHDYQFEYLAEVVRLVKSTGAKVVLVQHPLPRERVAPVRNYTDIIAAITKVAGENDVPFLNFHGTLELDTRAHFVDADHLNLAGARIFNAALLDELRRLRLLPPPRDPGKLARAAGR